MAPPKKQKREYNAGDVVWVKVKGWPIWPGQVEDIKNVTNDSVIKLKRKNAILIKFLENGSYSWATHDDVNPFQKETIEDFLISSNHKNFSTWKKAFKLCGKEAGVEASVLDEFIKKASKISSSPAPKKRKEREGEASPKTPKRRKSTSTSPSPKRTARHASTGENKRRGSSPKKSIMGTTPRKHLLKPTLDSNEALLNELSALLVKYHSSKEEDKIYQLLKIISNFALPDHSILATVSIGDSVEKLSKDKELTINIQKIATKIIEYYDSLKKVEEKEEEMKVENGSEGTEEKKESEDIEITENTESTEANPSDVTVETTVVAPVESTPAIESTPSESTPVETTPTTESAPESKPDEVTA